MLDKTEQGATDARRRTIAYAMSLVWLLFLTFPLITASQGGVPTLAGAASILITLTFAALYAASMVRHFRDPDRITETITSRTVGFMALLVALCVAQVFLIGTDALCLVVFLVPVAVFLLPPKPGYIAGACVVFATLAYPLLAREFWSLSFGIIASGVFLGCAGSVFFTKSALDDSRVASQEAVLDERERVARDIHDVLGHTLTAIALKSELAERLVDKDSAAAKREIALITQLSREGIADVRSTVLGLRVRQLGVELEQARSVVHEAGIDLTVIGEADDVDPRYRILFAWALREAMTNIVRHSHAKKAVITIHPRSIDITDNGVGFSGTSGNGLRGLRERVEDAGGSLILTGGNDGTRVQVQM